MTHLQLAVTSWDVRFPVCPQHTAICIHHSYWIEAHIAGPFKEGNCRQTRKISKR